MHIFSIRIEKMTETMYQKLCLSKKSVLYIKKQYYIRNNVIATRFFDYANILMTFKNDVILKF